MTTSTVTTTTLETKSGSLSTEGRKRRYEELRAKLGKSRCAVKGDPAIHYFWARKDDNAEMARLDMVGYSIVRESNAKEVMTGKAKPKIEAPGLREDGTYVYGDCILTCCPQEVYEFLLMDVEERHEDLVRSAKENFLNEAEKAGSPTFEINKR